jgi:parallel beta-helix repeat protein
VTLSGFTIQSLNYSTSKDHASGVKIAGDNCTVSANTIVGTYYGVFCSVQSFTTISNNNIIATLKDAIRICGGSQNTIAQNVITGNAQSGIAIDGYLDTIVENKITETTAHRLGCVLLGSFGNNLTDNEESGMYIASSDSIIAANNITQTNGASLHLVFCGAKQQHVLHKTSKTTANP